MTIPTTNNSEYSFRKQENSVAQPVSETIQRLVQRIVAEVHPPWINLPDDFTRRKRSVCEMSIRRQEVLKIGCVMPVATLKSRMCDRRQLFLEVNDNYF